MQRNGPSGQLDRCWYLAVPVRQSGCLIEMSAVELPIPPSRAWSVSKVPPVKRLIPWALVTVLALCAALTVAFTEAWKTPATPATLKAAQLSPSALGNGWKVLELRAATAPATGGLLACPGSLTISGPYSRAWFYKTSSATSRRVLP